MTEVSLRRAAEAREEARRRKNRQKIRAQKAEERLDAVRAVHDSWMNRASERRTAEVEMLLSDLRGALDAAEGVAAE